MALLLSNFKISIAKYFSSWKQVSKDSSQLKPYSPISHCLFFLTSLYTIHPSTHQSIHLCIHPSISTSMHVDIHPSIHSAIIDPSIYLCIHTSIHLCMHACIHPSTYMCIHIGIHSSMYPSTHFFKTNNSLSTIISNLPSMLSGL